MTTKTVKISEENYRWLVRFSGELQREIGRPVSIDQTLKFLHRGNLSELAGSWIMPDEEAKQISHSLSQGWRRWRISV